MRATAFSDVSPYSCYGIGYATSDATAPQGDLVSGIGKWHVRRKSKL
jgi:hypothetical protein